MIQRSYRWFHFIENIMFMFYILYCLKMPQFSLLLSSSQSWCRSREVCLNKRRKFLVRKTIFPAGQQLQSEIIVLVFVIVIVIYCCFHCYCYCYCYWYCYWYCYCYWYWYRVTEAVSYCNTLQEECLLCFLAVMQRRVRNVHSQHGSKSNSAATWIWSTTRRAQSWEITHNRRKDEWEVVSKCELQPCLFPRHSPKTAIKTWTHKNEFWMGGWSRRMCLSHVLVQPSHASQDVCQRFNLPAAGSAPPLISSPTLHCFDLKIISVTNNVFF